MSKILRISDAASMALHTMVLLAGSPDKLLSTKEMASTLNVSEAHLAKVLQRLAKAGFARSTRGPNGGFGLEKAPSEITLLDVYNAIEGPLAPTDCLLGTPVCGGKDCILGKLLETVNRRVTDYLAETRLSQLAGRCGREDENDKKDSQDL